MEHIEDTKPIDVLASRVWAGTRYAYPHIEQMASEMREMRARLAALDKVAKAAFELACVMPAIVPEPTQYRAYNGLEAALKEAGYGE